MKQKVLELADDLGCTITTDKIGNQFTITCDAPPEFHFVALGTGGHTLVVCRYEGFAKEAWKEMYEDLSDGITDCDCGEC